VHIVVVPVLVPVHCESLELELLETSVGACLGFFLTEGVLAVLEQAIRVCSDDNEEEDGYSVKPSTVASRFSNITQQ
jgi:hypothetical protein